MRDVELGVFVPLWLKNTNNIQPFFWNPKRKFFFKRTDTHKMCYFCGTFAQRQARNRRPGLYFFTKY